MSIANIESLLVSQSEQLGLSSRSNKESVYSNNDISVSATTDALIPQYSWVNQTDQLYSEKVGALRASGNNINKP